MALLSVEGTFRSGGVELAERPAGVAEGARVIVTFLPALDPGDRPDPAEGPGEEDRETRRRRAFARMEEGIDFGGAPYPKREELYDRFDR